MLSIYLGKMDGAIYHPPTYFDNQYEDEWITEELSGGVKTLMLMAFDGTGKVFNASVCGDNCAKWILEIANRKDLTINLRHIMDFGEGGFEARILNTGDMVHDMLGFARIAGKYV